MTNEEALNHFKNHEYMTDYSWQDEMSEIAIKAIEKQIPKKHHHTRIDHIVDDVRISVCPSCLAVIPSHRTEYPNYCISCGTKIDWGESE